MIIFYEEHQQLHRLEHPDASAPIPSNAVWVDLLMPTREQEQAVEAFLGFNIPTREEMSEIEISNRLYHEHGAHTMIATMLTRVDSDTPETHAVTFILTDHVLVTIRYVDATSFRRYLTNVVKMPPGDIDGPTIFMGLLQSIVNRKADILERLDRDIDRITKDIFRSAKAGKSVNNIDYTSILARIGRCGDLSSKTHESLVTFGRIAAYASHHRKLHVPEHLETIDAMRKDITGLTDHGTFLTGRVNFLLDATLGMISIAQNSVFRVLSIASLIFMPPTLVAGIYGMNFKLIPELDWQWGYPGALALMLITAILPYVYLKQRRYL